LWLDNLNDQAAGDNLPLLFLSEASQPAKLEARSELTGSHRDKTLYHVRSICVRTAFAEWVKG
jgi:hypothetical protein